jgi:hypothetical protein
VFLARALAISIAARAATPSFTPRFRYRLPLRTSSV